MIFPRNGFDDELSRSFYQDFTACQRPEIFSAFSSFIEKERPSLVVEIGTCYGGLTKSLSDSTKVHSIPFITYDIAENESSERLKKFNVDFRIENIFQETKVEEYTLKPYFLDYLLSVPSPVMILCDGGNKIGEFNAFAKVLRVGDILMAHDFSYEEEFFTAHSYWGWMEIQEKDIIGSMRKFHLSYYKMNIWSKLAWVCTKKIY